MSNTLSWHLRHYRELQRVGEKESPKCTRSAGFALGVGFGVLVSYSHPLDREKELRIRAEKEVRTLRDKLEESTQNKNIKDVPERSYSDEV